MVSEFNTVKFASNLFHPYKNNLSILTWVGNFFKPYGWNKNNTDIEIYSSVLEITKYIGLDFICHLISILIDPFVRSYQAFKNMRSSYANMHFITAIAAVCALLTFPLTLAFMAIALVTRTLGTLVDPGTISGRHIGEKIEKKLLNEDINILRDTTFNLTA